MYVLIAGGGVLGSALARSLAENRHDVVVVDSDRLVCERIASRLGALTFHGNASNIEVLEEAGIAKADVAVGALPGDGGNLAFALLARNFGVPRVFARMRNPRYEAAYRAAGVTKCINISEFFVGQLVLEIEQPTIHQVATFGGGKAAIVVLTIPEEALVHEKTVREIAGDELFPKDCVLAGIYRKDAEQFIFPRGDVSVLAGDHVFLAAETATIRRAAQFLQRTK